MKQNGFTLLELIIVVTVFGILLSIGTVNFSAWQKKYGIERQTKEMQSDFMAARLLAVQQKRYCRINLMPNSYTFSVYSTSSEYEASPQGPGTPVLAAKSLSYKITWNLGNSKIDFDPRGLILSAGDQGIVKYATAGIASEDCLSISTGRISSGKITDGNFACQIR